MISRMDKTAMVLQWAVYSFMPESRIPAENPNTSPLELGLEYTPSSHSRAGFEGLDTKRGIGQ